MLVQEARAPSLQTPKEALNITSAEVRPEVPTSLKDGRFQLDKKLGAGSFGEVWLGRDMQKSGDVIALKLGLKGVVSEQLVNEYEMLHDLKNPTQRQGILAVHWFATEMPWTYMVIECLGENLEQVFNRCNRKFEIPTIGLIAEQCLLRLETLHSRYYIHRDVKPENFMMGIGSRQHIVYITDFGLSEKYFIDGEHLRQAPDTLTGTAEFASLNAHSSSQSRRDDLESLGLMLIYFMKGSLPWFGLDARVANDGKDANLFKERLIVERKTQITPKELCKDLPVDIENYVKYVRKLSYKQRPDYGKLRACLLNLRNANGEVPDHGFQWLRGCEGFEVSSLEPIQPYGPQTQPDDEYKSFWKSWRK